MERTKDIPAHAKRVFHGLHFDVYRWSQKMFDGSTGTFERARKRDSVTIIPITADGRILMERQSQPHRPKPFICFPGGMVDDGKDARRTAERELLEETGYRAKRMRLWHIVSPHFRVSSDLYIYIAQGCTKETEPEPDNGEKIKLFTVTFPQFLKLAQRKDFRHNDITFEVFRALAYSAAMRALHARFFGKTRKTA